MKHSACQLITAFLIKTRIGKTKNDHFAKMLVEAFKRDFNLQMVCLNKWYGWKGLSAAPEDALSKEEFHSLSQKEHLKITQLA